MAMQEESGAPISEAHLEGMRDRVASPVERAESIGKKIDQLTKRIQEQQVMLARLMKRLDQMEGGVRR